MNDFWNTAWLVLAGLLPFLGFLLVCFIVMRAIFNADRNERAAIARLEKAYGKDSNSDAGPGVNHPDEAPAQDQSDEAQPSAPSGPESV
ncbi:MAG: hypothetical protein GXY39_00910 [Actinomycetales bacterium]|nr:hypothetical protein [Actinomycetales bacterium]